MPGVLVPHFPSQLKPALLGTHTDLEHSRKVRSAKEGSHMPALSQLELRL